MSIGYLILAHRDPRQLQTLVTDLRAQTDGPILVHLDLKARPLFSDCVAALERLERVVVISRRAVHWGGFSIVQATLDGARELLARWPEVSHVKHLSGQDYPIRPLAEFEAWVGALGGRSAIDHNPLPYSEWGAAGGLDRVDRVWLYRGKHRVAWPLRRALPPGVTFHGGSAFWCLARAHLQHVLDRRDALAALFRRSFIPDETYFHTLVLNSPYREEVVNFPLTLTLWRSNASSPQILTVWDLDQILQAEGFFGRKFDSFLSSELIEFLRCR